jgi:hypothetical protein
MSVKAKLAVSSSTPVDGGMLLPSIWKVILRLGSSGNNIKWNLTLKTYFEYNRETSATSSLMHRIEMRMRLASMFRASAEEVEGTPNGARLAPLTLALELFPLPLPLPLLTLGSAWNLVPRRTIPSRAMKSVKKLVEAALLVGR